MAVGILRWILSMLSYLLLQLSFLSGTRGRETNGFQSLPWRTSRPADNQDTVWLLPVLRERWEIILHGKSENGKKFGEAPVEMKLERELMYK